MEIKQKVTSYLEDIQTPTGLIINLIIIGLICLSLAIFVIQTYAIPESIRIWLNDIDFAILIIFALEYIIRFWCAKAKIKFIFSFFSLIDLLSIIPLFIGLVDIRFLLVFRWFRLLRLIRFLDVGVSVFRIKREDAIVVARIFLILISTVFCYSGLIYQIEHQVNPNVFDDFFDALYFSVVTMTTVGFGDVIPLSEFGRLVTLLMILTGIVLIPWQISDLVRQLLKSTGAVNKICFTCGLSLHDRDANFCKLCGNKLES